MDIKKEYERWLVNATADADIVDELKTLDAKTAYVDGDFVVIAAPTNVYSTNRIDVATSKRTCFAHYIGY